MPLRDVPALRNTLAEKATNSRILKALRGARLDPVRIENGDTSPGTPDINFVWGWIEDKFLDHWPRRGGIVKVPHFVQEQRVWLTRRRIAGGGAWLFLQVGREYLLFDGRTAAEVLGLTDEETLRRAAIKVWTSGLNDSELIECLRSTRP